MNRIFSGKNMIITGASRGLGRALALAFAEEGTNLCLIGRNIDKLKQVYEEACKLDGGGQ